MESGNCFTPLEMWPKHHKKRWWAAHMMHWNCELYLIFPTLTLYKAKDKKCLHPVLAPEYGLQDIRELVEPWLYHLGNDKIRQPNRHMNEHECRRMCVQKIRMRGDTYLKSRRAQQTSYSSPLPPRIHPWFSALCRIRNHSLVGVHL